MFRSAYITVLLASVLLATSLAAAQSQETSLGDLARTLRKNQPPPRAVIDNDNLSQVMEQGENKRWASSGLRPDFRNAALQFVNASSPDVTCALSFSGQKDLLDDSSRPQFLPEDEISKLDGPATMVGDSLQLSIHNGSNWDLREITVGLTLVQRPNDTLSQIDAFRLLPAAINSPVGLEKRSDVTVLYHLKGSAAPSTRALFQAPLNLTIDPDQEWHWAIVEAKGIRPAAPPDTFPTQPLIQAPN